jgi:prophage regulatory protein
MWGWRRLLATWIIGVVHSLTTPLMKAVSDQTETRKRGTVHPQPLDAAKLPDALLTLRTAGAIAGLSEATLYRKAASDPTFPKLVKLGTRCTRIRAGDLTAWLASLGRA